MEGVDSTPVVLSGDAVPAVQYDVEAAEMVLSMAPVDLPANAGHNAVRQAPALTAELPHGGWLGGYTVEVLDRDGRAVPRATIHHVNIMAPDRRELFSDIMQRVGAVGAETAPVRLPRLLGYPVKSGERIIVIAELHNPTADAYNGVRVIVRMPHMPENTWPRPLAVQPFYLDVTPPASSHSFDLPPGRSEAMWEGTAPLSGRILGMGGHLHDHAIELRLEDVTEERVIWQTEPILDENGRLVAMEQETFLLKLGLPVEAGHTYRLVAAYDNPTGDTLVAGGMGALGGIIMPAGDSDWPAANPDHPEYIEDVAYRIADRDREPSAAPESSGAHSHH